MPPFQDQTTAKHRLQSSRPALSSSDDTASLPVDSTENSGNAAEEPG